MMVNEEGSISFLEHFSILPDPRQAAKVLYPLAEILLLVLCAVICGGNTYVEIVEYGEERLEFLRQFLPFQHGIPSHDALGDLFAKLDHFP